MRYSLALVLWNVCLFCLQEICANLDMPKTEIVIAGLFPTSHDIAAGKIGRGVRPAVQLALDIVNNDTNILHNYQLNMTWNDTQVCYLSFYFFAINLKKGEMWANKFSVTAPFIH